MALSLDRSMYTYEVPVIAFNVVAHLMNKIPPRIAGRLCALHVNFQAAVQDLQNAEGIDWGPHVAICGTRDLRLLRGQHACDDTIRISPTNISLDEITCITDYIEKYCHGMLVFLNR